MFFGTLKENPLLVAILLTVILLAGHVDRSDGAQSDEYELLRQGIVADYAALAPQEWGPVVTGVKTALATEAKVIALTFDACGGGKGNGADRELLAFLEQERIPAALFINGRWIDANRELFATLARNPLFTIANHGSRHRPASVNGRAAYGITGTRTVAELVDEIELNNRKIMELTGQRPSYYRSGTAFYDEVAVAVAGQLGQQVVGYTVLGDAGAIFSAEQVAAALLTARPGAIAILHMNHPGSGTAKGVMAAVPELRRRGFRFVHLDEYPLR